MVNNMDFRMEMPGEASAMFQEDTWLNTGSVIAGVAVVALAIGLKSGYKWMGDAVGDSMDKAMNDESFAPSGLKEALTKGFTKNIMPETKG